MNRIGDLEKILGNSQQEKGVDLTKKLLKENLYCLDPISKDMNKDILSRVYSPGVGAVCKAIEKDPSLADKTTLRGRSVAIVTDGSFLQVEGKKAFPVMDWLVVQIKYYSGLDAFPFVIRKGSNIDEICNDLSTCYRMILCMDNCRVQKAPENSLVIHQKDIVEVFQCQVSCLENTAQVLAALHKQQFKGIPSKDDLKEAGQGKAQYVKPAEQGHFKIDKQADLNEDSLKLHREYQGKMKILLNFKDIEKLKPHFTNQILKKLVKEKGVYSKSGKLSAIITDGTAILGFGDIGPLAGLPVMEGKSLLFNMLGGVDVVPVCLYPRKSTEEEIEAILNLVGNFFALNLEDIKAPQCFEIEGGLKKVHQLPVFHDDQHGTAIVVLAGLINACKCVKKQIAESKVLINGAGAAGITIAKMLLDYGFKDVIICDSKGAIYEGRENHMNDQKTEISKRTNKDNKKGQLGDVIEGRDIFVGVSVGDVLKGEMVKKMSKDSIIFALANPDPEIGPEDAKKNGAKIYGSGRSNYENQINNSLAFPGIFMAITQHEISDVTSQMKVTAAEAIAASLQKQLSPEFVVPDMLDKNVAIKISDQLGKLNLPKKKQ